MDVTLTMPTGEESEVADHIDIRVRDSQIDAGEYGANEYPLGTLYISSQTNELRFHASIRLTDVMEARFANVPLAKGLTVPSGKWLWRRRMMRRMRKLNRVRGTR